jgi:KDO2-lipid IV(A) lauroyltransferase
MSVIEKIKYNAILLGVKALSHIPFGVLYVLSDILFYPFYFVVRYRRRIVRKNLTESFPEKSVDEIIRIEREFYHFFIDTTLESCKLMSISREEIMRRMKFTNIELPNSMLRDGRSVSLFLGHFGNWEWISTMSLWLEKDIIPAQIYHKLRNNAVDKIMMTMRERTGTHCVDMKKTVRYMVDASADSRPCIIGFIADQSPKRRDAKHLIPFLNHQVPVLTGTEKATKHFGYEALFVSVKRVKRGYYECEFVPLHDDPKSLPDFELTDLYFRHLEKTIQRHPELYLWTHNRFKYAIRSGSDR